MVQKVIIPCQFTIFSRFFSRIQKKDQAQAYIEACTAKLKSSVEWVTVYITMTECFDFSTLIVLPYDLEKERQFQISNSTVKFSWAWRLSFIPKVLPLCCTYRKIFDILDFESIKPYVLADDKQAESKALVIAGGLNISLCWMKLKQWKWVKWIGF